MVLVLLSCGRDQSTGPLRAPGGIARGLSFNAVFPAMSNMAAFASFVDFDRVRVRLHHTDGAVALDTMVTFPAGADAITLSFDVILAAGAPAAGELMTLDLSYVNAKGDTVFRGGPVQLRAVASVEGVPPPPPVSIPVIYSGPGASAATVRISPRTLTVNANAPFAFTGVASNATGGLVADAPIIWVTLDPTLATVPVPTLGSGTASAARGTARIIAQLLNGAKDTVTLNVIPVPTGMAVATGNNQAGVIGKPSPQPLAQPIVVRVTAADGLGVLGVSVTFAAANGGSVSPATVVTDTAGLAQTTWSLGAAASAQTATATVAGLTGSPVTLNATGAAKLAAKLVLSSGPAAGADVLSGTPTPLVVAAQDADGDPAIGFTGDVTVAIATNPSGGTLAGGTTVAAVAGVASFPSISIAKQGAGYVLQATSGALTPVSTNAFNIVTGPAANLVLVSGDAQSGAAGSALALPVVAFVTDAFGNGVSNVTVTFTVATGGGSTAPPSGTTDATGRIGSTWTLGSSSTSQSLTVGSTGLASATATATASGASLAWIVKAQPAATQSAGTITPAVVVELKDGGGTIATSFNGSVTAAIVSGPSGGTLSGTTNVTASSGVASFSGLTLTKPGTYTLGFSSSGAASVTSAAFTVNAGSGSALSVESGGSQSGTLGSMLGAPVVLKVTDIYGNAVAGKSVTFAVTSGGGSVGTPSATTDASGLASTTWTLGPSGAQTISGTSSGLTGSPITISAVSSGGSVARTVVSPRTDTLTSLGATRALSAQARDVSDNVVVGSFSWVSRNPSIATVSSGGVVTAVANGSAYVVALEIGGTRDSALMVVQQRTATVNITPAARSLYVLGTFTYSAVAVDGRGNAMASQPVFSWSSTSPTVASADAGMGAVTALSIGSTQIRATAGATIGVSVLTVLTPIKRIVVGLNTDGQVVPDTFTMTALGLRRGYRAEARDTLDAVMTGVIFTWSSTNGSVAAIDAPTATTAGAISAANGVTSIQASAQGVTGSAALYVAQVLASIELTPATASVSISGSTALLARGKDSQNRYISGGTFTYTSSGPTIATVNSTTGVVTGVANGSANITAASGSVTSNGSLITVSNTNVPPVISFGRDTIGVGRGSSISVPILLSKPNGTPLVINLAAVDTNAYWSTATVTIPAGATSGNATLQARNAGTTRVSALDGSGAGYAGATAVVAVQANMKLTTTYYSLNATDQLSTQVVLSDPSPAGGTYVTFSYGTAGRASVSPDPAFIPPGQLAADIVIRGIAAGTTTLTPLATGVSGTGATVVVAAATLSIPYQTIILGAGQYEQYMYVSVPNLVSNPLVVALANSDSSVAFTVPSVTVPTTNYYAFFDVNGRATGKAQVTASAAGWTSASLAVTVSTPKLSVCCNYTLNSTSPAQAISIYTADSTNATHNRLSSLAVRITSSDTTVVKVLDTLVTVAAGTYYSGAGRVIPNGIGGTAWIKVSAGGHIADSVKFTVVGPALTFAYTTRRLGVGQVEPNGYIAIPNAISKPLVITLTNSDSTVAATNATVTIPVGANSSYFELRGRGTGSNTIIASAPGYISDTSTTDVTTPRVKLAGSSSLNSYATYTTNVYAEDSVGTIHNRMSDLTVTLRSSDTTVLKVDTVGVIAAGAYYVSAGIRLTAVNPGTAKIYVTAPGHLPDSVSWTVTPARVALSWKQYFIGARQHQLPGAFYPYIPNARNVSVAVTLTHTNAAAVSLSTSTVTIPASGTYAFFDLAGVLPGIDTVIATATGYSPDTGYVRVTTPRLVIASLPTTGTTTSPNATVQFYVSDSTTAIHYANDTVVVRAVSSDPNVVKPTAAYFRILKDSYVGTTGFQFVGPGTATITYSDSGGAGIAYTAVTSNTVTVTGPSLSIASGNGMLGTGQHTAVNANYVYLPNLIGAPLKVALVSTDPRVATVPDTVVVPAGSYYAYFTITAQDTIGTVQIQATAVGYTPSSVNMQVTKPKFIISANTSLYTTSPPGYMYVYAADENGNGHVVNSDLVVKLLSSAPGVASIDSTSITITKDSYYSYAAHWTPGSVGAAQLSASDERVIRYPYTTGTENVSVVTPPAYLSFGTASLGLGQYIDAYTSVPDATTSALAVPLTHAATPTTSTPSSVTIPALGSYVYFRVQGTSIGPDTITASPAGHTPAVGIVNVTQGIITPLGGWPTNLAAGDSAFITLYTRGTDGSTHPVVAATTFTLGSNANLAFVKGGVTITSAVVPADSYYVQFYVKAVTAGTASAVISNANYLTYNNTVTVSP